MTTEASARQQLDFDGASLASITTKQLPEGKRETKVTITFGYGMPDNMADALWGMSAAGGFTIVFKGRQLELLRPPVPPPVSGTTALSTPVGATATPPAAEVATSDTPAPAGEFIVDMEGKLVNAGLVTALPEAPATGEPKCPDHPDAKNWRTGPVSPWRCGKCKKTIPGQAGVAPSLVP